MFADSPEVKIWMKELDGFYIPNISPTKDGTCAGDPAAAAESAKRGWWTCGGYTRSTGMCPFAFSFCKRWIGGHLNMIPLLSQDIEACPDKLTWGVR